MYILENTVSIPSEELEELKRQAEEINKKIKELGTPRQIAPYVSERPLSCPRNLKDDEPIFGYSKWVNQDVWNAFIKLAKTIHEESPRFYMDSAPTSCYYRRKPYIRSTRRETIRRIDQLSTEQIRISGEMLSEMVAIYNRYFVMLHEKVVYDPKDGSGPRLVDVIPPLEVM